MTRQNRTREARNFRLTGLNGISDEQIAEHLGLYAGYVKHVNQLGAQLPGLLRDGLDDPQRALAYAELKRHLTFELNGVLLHELYFGNLKAGGAPAPDSGSAFAEAAARSFGSVDAWRADFLATSRTRGPGWTLCAQDPQTGLLWNVWIQLHEMGHAAGFVPVLVLDLWEHAYLRDYKADKRGAYTDAFFTNVDWSAVEQRLG